MSLFDIFLKRGQPSFRRKNHYHRDDLKDIDSSMGLFKSSTPAPLIRQEDGSMMVPGGGHSFHRVDVPHRSSRHSRAVRSNQPGPMMLDEARETYGDGGGRPSHHPGRSGRHGSSRHLSQHPAEPSYHYGQTGQLGLTHHSGYGNQHGNPPFGGISQHHEVSRHWSQQANPSRQVSQHDWANPASGHPAPPQSPFEQPREPSQRAPSNQQPQHQPDQRPAPRPGKFHEGDHLPTGVVDPLATISANHPLGHHGMRQHVKGMTMMNPERHGKADDPMANFKVLEEMAAFGSKRRSKRR